MQRLPSVRITGALLLFNFLICYGQEGQNKSENANEDIVFTVIENDPVFPGCAEFKTRSGANRCMNTKMSKIIGNNFNLNKTKNLDVTGRIKLYIKYIVNKKGEIQDLEAFSPNTKINKELKEEIERVFTFIPTMEKPAMQRGRPVKAAYSIPLTLDIPEKEKSLQAAIPDKKLSKKEKRKLKRAAKKLERKLKRALN